LSTNRVRTDFEYRTTAGVYDCRRLHDPACKPCELRDRAYFTPMREVLPPQSDPGHRHIKELAEAVELIEEKKARMSRLRPGSVERHGSSRRRTMK
jgi:hypothetical protein